MNLKAIRGGVAVLNLVLLGVVGYTAYLTFFHTEPARWEVEPPGKSEQYAPPSLADDPYHTQLDIYQVVSKVFERKVPVETTPTVPEVRQPVPQAPKRGDPKHLNVELTTYDPADPSSCSVWLRGPSGEARTFTVDMPLEVYPEFRAYTGVKVTQITSEEIVLTDGSGKEVRLSAKPGGGR